MSPEKSQYFTDRIGKLTVKFNRAALFVFEKKGVVQMVSKLITKTFLWVRRREIFSLKTELPTEVV